MNQTLAALLAPLLILWIAIGARGDDKKPDRTIEVARKDGKVTFTEAGQDKAKPVQVVVGETVRWVNRDNRPHTLRAVAEFQGKPLFQTEVIRPGESKDLLFDIELYRKAGGRTASFVALKYQCGDGSDVVGELVFLSAARR